MEASILYEAYMEPCKDEDYSCDEANASDMIERGFHAVVGLEIHQMRAPSRERAADWPGG